jgi:hypothetical protein
LAPTLRAGPRFATRKLCPSHGVALERRARVDDVARHGGILNQPIGLPQGLVGKVARVAQDGDEYGPDVRGVPEELAPGSSPDVRPASHAVSPFKKTSAHLAIGKAE